MGTREGSTAPFFNEPRFQSPVPKLQCPKCGQSVEDVSDEASWKLKFYPRHQGRGYWVCLECNRGFHETGLVVS
jgi:uncharacterized protein with PIN domain